MTLPSINKNDKNNNKNMILYLNLESDIVLSTKQVENQILLNMPA